MPSEAQILLLRVLPGRRLGGLLESLIHRDIPARPLDGYAVEQLLDGAELDAGEFLAVEGAGVEAGVRQLRRASAWSGRRVK